MDDALTTIYSSLGQSDKLNKEIGYKTVLGNDGGSTDRPSGSPKTVHNSLRDKAASSDKSICPNGGDDPFFALARALWLRGQQDAPLALALIAWGQENAPDAVEAITGRSGDLDWVRRCLGSLARKMARIDPDALNWHAADDPETLAILQPYIEKKLTPDWMAWADRHVAYKLDRHDLAVIEHIRTSDARERAAIIEVG